MEDKKIKKTTRTKSAKKTAPVKRVKPKPKAKQRLVKKTVPVKPAPVLQPLDTVVNAQVAKLQATKHQPKHGPAWHYVVVIVGLAILCGFVLATISGFADLTYNQILQLQSEEVRQAQTTPVATDNLVTPAGNFTIGLPTDFVRTELTDTSTQYHHATEPAVKFLVTVTPNETENIFTWLQAQALTYTKATMQTNATVSALRGVMLTATSTTGEPVQLVYLPITTSSGDKYVASLQLTSSATTTPSFTNAVWRSVLSNWRVE